MKFLCKVENISKSEAISLCNHLESLEIFKECFILYSITSTNNSTFASIQIDSDDENEPYDILIDYHTILNFSSTKTTTKEIIEAYQNKR
jgi:hypothetical protein